MRAVMMVALALALGGCMATPTATPGPRACNLESHDDGRSWHITCLPGLRGRLQCGGLAHAREICTGLAYDAETGREYMTTLHLAGAPSRCDFAGGVGICR
jgi:hypothetical protein